MPAYRFLFLPVLATFIACSSQNGEVTERPGQYEADSSDTGTTELRYDSFSRLHSSSGQLIYVPVYSHIYQRNQQKTFNLTATLSFRNADLNRPLRLTRVVYYDSQGQPVKNYLDSPMDIEPLASTSFVIEEDDLRGGVGANFIVEWESHQAVYPPVVEAVMISTTQQQGISFVSAGRVLEEKQ